MRAWGVAVAACALGLGLSPAGNDVAPHFPIFQPPGLRSALVTPETVEPALILLPGRVRPQDVAPMAMDVLGLRLNWLELDEEAAPDRLI